MLVSILTEVAIVMRKFSLFLIVMAGFFTGADAYAQSFGRGFLFQGGLGFVGIAYPNDLEDVLSSVEDAGVDRVQLNLHLGVGFGIGGNLYASFLIDGYADRLDDGIDYLQLNTFLYGFGIHGYPFGTGLVLAGHVGPARTVLQSSIGDDTSPWGQGFNLMIGYDFIPTIDGSGFLVGLRLGSALIDGESIGLATVFASYTYR